MRWGEAREGNRFINILLREGLSRPSPTVGITATVFILGFQVSRKDLPWATRHLRTPPPPIPEPRAMSHDRQPSTEPSPQRTCRGLLPSLCKVMEPLPPGPLPSGQLGSGCLRALQP